MSPELAQIRREAESLTRVFSQEQWHRAPQGKWSCGQILEHLRLAYALTTAGAQKAIRSGKPLGSQPTIQEGLKTFVVTRLGFLPSGRISPDFVRPVDVPKVDSLRPFNDALVAMDASLTDAEKRFGIKVKLLDHPVIGPLTAQQWRRFHRVHTRHHLKQMAKRAKEVELLYPNMGSLTGTGAGTSATHSPR